MAATNKAASLANRKTGQLRCVYSTCGLSGEVSRSGTVPQEPAPLLARGHHHREAVAARRARVVFVRGAREPETVRAIEGREVEVAAIPHPRTAEDYRMVMDL